MANGFARPYMLQVATAAEAALNPDMLLVRYNGHPGEDISDFQLENRGADLQWYGRIKGSSQPGPGYPVKVRAGGWCAIPNLPENLEILENMKGQKWSVREQTPNGPIERTIKHPPLYERVEDEVQQVSPEALMAAFAGLSAEAKARLLGDLTAPVASDEAPRGRKGRPQEADAPASE